MVKNGRFYACLSCEVEAQPLPPTEKQIGVDLGVKHLAITSDGQFSDSPKYLRKNEKRLKYLQRQVSRKKKGSKRRKKAVRVLAKQHEKVANQRKDYAHKVAKQLVNQYQLIAFEDLNVQDMVKNHHLANSISDAGWNQLVQFVTYKAESAGRQVVQVNPYNTSQRCSNCDEIVKKTPAVRFTSAHIVATWQTVTKMRRSIF
ncbi:transposase [Fodinisporobacter ferrooxydans]|uniref:Transposase n=1 Tax=Fodinisporobacter ferrooxydans TaxID=2901836 RepID=A0ABY4CR67_9BACL|nr:transposase [Alicyclobacillaceae bacterium MYW30-H2]